MRREGEHFMLRIAPCGHPPIYMSCRQGRFQQKARGVPGFLLLIIRCVVSPNLIKCFGIFLSCLANFRVLQLLEIRSSRVISWYNKFFLRQRIKRLT